MIGKKKRKLKKVKGRAVVSLMKITLIKLKIVLKLKHH